MFHSCLFILILYLAMNLPCDEFTKRWIYHAMNLPCDEFSMRWFYHAMNFPYDEFPMRWISHTMNLPCNKFTTMNRPGTNITWARCFSLCWKLNYGTIWNGIMIRICCVTYVSILHENVILLCSSAKHIGCMIQILLLCSILSRRQ